MKSVRVGLSELSMRLFDLVQVCGLCVGVFVRVLLLLLYVAVIAVHSWLRIVHVREVYVCFFFSFLLCVGLIHRSHVLTLHKLVTSLDKY